MPKKIPHILGIDRGSKYIGLAYMTHTDQIPLPIGYIENDGMTLFTLSEYFYKYHIDKVIMGRPPQEPKIQHRIEKFLNDLLLVIDHEVLVEKIDEDYSTIQAGEVVSNYKKNATTDTISAMILLERRTQGQ